MSPAGETSSLSPDRQREKALFDQALDLATDAEREAFLERHCADDPALRDRLSRLLALNPAAAGFFDFQPAAPDVPDSAADHPIDLDRYRLLHRLGEGGCGVVYMAEQLQPVKRHVALKIIRLGMNTPAGVARFELERRSLALMDHPNIARVLEAGATPSGLPYFVMEWVQGARITDYCEEHRLDLPRRLELLIDICHAVQHAHQKGVVHRDIKPANILVTLHDGRAVPKLIDFGIAAPAARSSADAPPDAEAHPVLGTPAYMSPEQAGVDGADVDTRSDIYGLGVLLAELLVGRPPFDAPAASAGKDAEAILRHVRERRARPPSALLAGLDAETRSAIASARRCSPRRLLAALHQDLDWIVLKAVAGDRRDRYETANALATDLRRCLDHEPVAARPPARLYRLRKLVRRNRSIFATGTLVTLALVAGLGASTWLFLREREARREQDRLREVADQARAIEAELRQRAEIHEKVSQAAVLLRYGETAEADRLFERHDLSFVPPSLECADVMRALGTWHAIEGRWPEAAARFHALGFAITRADSADSDDVSRDLLQISAAIAESGDTARYESFRKLALDRFGRTESPVVAEQILKTCLLLPAGPALLAALEAPADVARGSLSPKGPHADRNPHMSAWRAFALALFEYRRGRPAAAGEWAERCLAYRHENHPRQAAGLALLALARHDLGHDKEARAALARCRDLLGDRTQRKLSAGNVRDVFWFDWIDAGVLLREAEATLAAPDSPALPPSAPDADPH